MLRRAAARRAARRPAPSARAPRPRSRARCGRSMREQPPEHALAPRRATASPRERCRSRPAHQSAHLLGSSPTPFVVDDAFGLGSLGLGARRAPRGSAATSASSPSCVPSATTLPPSSNTTRSASAIVAGRWAMMIVVRPCITSASAARISCSFDRVDRRRRVVEDQDARVGEHRARDRDALPLPARERVAVLADDRVVAVGQLAHELVGARELRGAHDRFHRRFRIGERDVVAHQSENRNVSSNTRPTARRTSRRRTSRTSAPSMRTCPASHVVEARDQPRDGRLARRGRTDERDRLAAVDHEVEPVEHAAGRGP